MGGQFSGYDADEADDADDADDAVGGAKNYRLMLNWSFRRMKTVTADILVSDWSRQTLHHAEDDVFAVGLFIRHRGSLQRRRMTAFL